MTNPSPVPPSVTALRTFYVKLVAGQAGVSDPRIIAALEAVPREQFVGPGPWKVFALSGGYIETPSDDPAFLYQDVLIALSGDRGINNGQPSLHARCLAALGVSPGEAVLHIGAGTGYYTAVLANLVGPKGSVSAYEIEPDLARWASANLEGLPTVKVHALSGCEAGLGSYDAIYVNAGATHPLDAWLDALRPKGRLLFPLTPDAGMGGMLLVTRGDSQLLCARFVVPAMFVPCQGARDRATWRSGWRRCSRRPTCGPCARSVAGRFPTNRAGAPERPGGCRQRRPAATDHSAERCRMSLHDCAVWETVAAARSNRNRGGSR